MINRNILVLFFGQCVGFSATSFLVLVTGILAARIGPSEKLVTLPLSLAVVGTAMTAIPAALLMKRIGRKRGFLLACGIAAVAGLSGFLSAWFGNFYLLCGCTVLTGCAMAFVHQFRFAAMESVDDPDRAAPTLSFLLLAGVIAAFLGPEIAEWGKDLLARPFAGSFLIMTAMFGLAALVFVLFRNPAVDDNQAGDRPQRAMTTIARQPVFVIALTGAVVAYAVMSFIMTATPISMHHIDGFEFARAKRVIQYHVAAMFLPSLFNIVLFRYIGLEKLIVAGAAIYVAVAVIALQGHEYVHYTASLILLGVGWNFLFVSCTALLPRAYRHHERFKVQALNDFTIYTVQALASLSAGWLLFAIGWDAMIRATLPLCGIMLLVAVVYWRNRRRP